MKKLISFMLIVAMLLMGVTALAASTVTMSGDAFVRTGPGLGYGEIGTAKKGTTLTYQNSKATDERGVVWYKVAFKDHLGWVSSKYATLSGGSSSSSSKSGSNPGSGSTTVSGKLTATGNVNIRSGPGKDYADVGTLKKGQTANWMGDSSVDDRGVTWYRITSSSGNGWVSSKYVTFGSSSSKSSYNGSGKTIVITGSVNVRSGPGTYYARLGALNQGKTVTWLGDTEVDDRGVAWYKISFNDGVGWVSSKFASFDTGSYSKNGGNTVVATGDVTVRTGPGLDYGEKGVLKKGKSATWKGQSSVDDRGVTWYRISFGSGAGWVSSKHVELK